MTRSFLPTALEALARFARRSISWAMRPQFTCSQQTGLVLDRSRTAHQFANVGMQVTAKGWFFVRAVAMVFDRYLQTDQKRKQFSRVI